MTSKRGETRDVLVLMAVALGAEPGGGGVQVAGVSQYDGIEDQPQNHQRVCEARMTCMPRALVPAGVAPMSVA